MYEEAYRELTNKEPKEINWSQARAMMLENNADLDAALIELLHIPAIYMSLDPYMRGRMNDAKSYAKPVALGEVMEAGGVGEVIESRSPSYKPGDIVVGPTGWQEYSALGDKFVRKIDPGLAPISTSVGVLGMPGLTAYSGLMTFGKPCKGESIVVSAASGAVGSVVGQIAKLKGCHVIGVAGSDDKCEYAVNEFDNAG